MPQARDDALQETLEAIVSDVGADLQIHRASVRLLEEGNTLRIVALWSDVPTLLDRDLAYQATASSLDEVIARPAEPLLRMIDPDRSPVDALLWEDGIRVHATLPLYREGLVVGLFSISSRDPDAFSNRDLSDIQTYADRLSEVLTREA